MLMLGLIYFQNVILYIFIAIQFSLVERHLASLSHPAGLTACARQSGSPEASELVVMPLLKKGFYKAIKFAEF